jgi:hypothetical protein
MKIARVFPRRTNLSPDDPDAYFWPPDLFTPSYDKILISVTFTWDIAVAQSLAVSWTRKGPVKIGGPAIDGESRGEFTPGLFIRRGAIITSRGCPNRCPWCFIRAPLKELIIHEGNNILDNNILACSPGHLDRLWSMLRRQHSIRFSGGLEAERVTPAVVDRFRSLRIADLFLAYDDESRWPGFVRAVELLRPHFNRERLHAFVLIGRDGDTLDRALGRLVAAYEAGVMPFAMLYRPADGSIPEPRRDWMKLHKQWSRPAIIKSLMRRAQPHQ